jgi:hypothetical protein
MQYKCKRFTFIVLGTFHSKMTVVVLLHTQMLPISDCWHLILSKHLEHSSILPVLPQIVCTILWVSVTLQHMSAIHSHLSNLLIMSDFSSILIVIHQFFIWIALGYVYLGFLLILIRKTNAFKRLYLANINNPYMWLMAWLWCHFLLTSYRK